MKITAHELARYLKPGYYIGCEENGDWYVFDRKPAKTDIGWFAASFSLEPFDIKPCENWETSLIASRNKTD